MHDGFKAKVVGRRRRGVPHLTLIGLAVAATVSGALAQPSHRSARKSQPAPLTRAAPDVTATIPAVKPQAPSRPVLETRDYGETLPKPFDLPVASRPRMRACGEQWQTIKMAGRAGSDTWREFAEKCLAERDNAAKTPSP